MTRAIGAIPLLVATFGSATLSHDTTVQGALALGGIAGTAALVWWAGRTHQHVQDRLDRIERDIDNLKNQENHHGD
jgi:trehalose utilization protein